MTDRTAPTLHVLSPPEPGSAGVPAGELLYAKIAATQGERDGTLLFGSSVDRRAAERLGVRNMWLARRPSGLGSRRILSRITGHAVRRLGRGPEGGHGAHGVARVVVWNPELRFLGETPDATDAGRHAEVALERMPVRAEARSALGLGDEPVVAPLSASPRYVDARALAFVSGVLDLLGERHTLLLPERCRRLDEGLRFIRQTELLTRVVLVPPPLLVSLPAADVLVEAEYTEADLDGPVPGALRAIGDGLGVPVASTAGWDTARGIGHGNLPPEIRATVGPAVRALRGVAHA